MSKILIINGPNLNLLGTREINVYGNATIEEIKEDCIKKGKEINMQIDFRQTNSEGEIINWLHEVNREFDGLIINPAGYTHTSISILDSLKSINKPKIEIHLSNIYQEKNIEKNLLLAKQCKV